MSSPAKARSAKAVSVLLLLGMGAGIAQTPPVPVPPVPTPPPGTGSVVGAVVKALGGAATQSVKAVGKALEPKPDDVKKAVEKILTPQISEFVLDGFPVTRVEPAADTTPAAFSGKGYLVLPAPLGGLEVTFQNLTITGNQAAGSLTAEFSSGKTVDHQGWQWAPTSVKISDKGSHLLGTMAMGHLKVVLDTATFTHTGLTGSLLLGDIPLAEGPFKATLEGAEILFSEAAPSLKGNLRVTLDGGFRNGDTGVPVDVTSPVAFDPALLSGTGVLCDALAADLPVEDQGLVFRMEKLTYALERGVPLLRGSARLGFPLQTFCMAASTGQPYLSSPSSATLRGTAYALDVTRPAAGMIAIPQLAGQEGIRGAANARVTTPTLAASPVAVHRTEPRGFSGAFPLPAATLLPSGLTTYHLKVEAGTAVVKEGALDAENTRITGSVSWGPGWTSQVLFKDAAADLEDGLYLTRAYLQGEVAVGAYGVQTGSLLPVVCDFSTTRSPGTTPPAWKGIRMPGYLLALPEEIFRFDAAYDRMPVFVPAKDGAFEANGGFSGKIAVNLPGEVFLHVMPLKMDPFDLEFADGVVLDAPRVQGKTTLDKSPVLPDFFLPIAFDLGQNGASRIQINTQTPQGDVNLKTDLVGVDIVLASAMLNPTNIDLSGRFDFHLKGAPLPSITFDHMVMEVTGGGIEGVKAPYTYAVVGSLWSNMQGQPRVSLWGYGFGLQENGYGTKDDGRFFVGFGGDMDINPVLSSVYNRVLFTTEKDNPETGTVEIEKGFEIQQSLPGMGSMQGSLNFKVDTAGDDVSDAYFLGTGKVKLDMGDAPLNLDAGFRFGRSYKDTDSFPYFYLLGHANFPESGIAVAPDVEIYGLSGGLTQNFKPDEIRNTETITGTPDKALGIGIMAGVQVGTSDNYTFHGDLDLYVAQNLTTLIQGQGYLMAGREDTPPDRTVTADISFTRSPNTFHAVLDADLTFYSGLLHFVGTVEMKFDPTTKFLHIGTPQSPLTATYMNGLASGNGYFDADFTPSGTQFTAGGGFSLDSGNRDFGIVWGRLYVNVWGDLIVVIDPLWNASMAGTLNMQGGAAFGMKFETFWHTYRVTIFSGDIAANMAFRAPGSPTLSGHVDVSYSVLGGLFSGSAGVDMEF